MTTDRWRQVRELFDAVMDQPAEKRAGFLCESTGGDLDLRREVEELLASFEQSNGMLTTPAAVGLDIIPPDKSEAMEGRRLGVYRILKKIGVGGMGSVYMAARDDQEFEQRVAIKLVRPGMNTGIILQRFLMERQVLAGLDHPNIARLLDGGTTDEGLPYIAMEYVDGTPIDQYADEQKLNTTQRIQLFRTVCDAVQYAHQNLIVHRDIKPANILVTPQNVVKLLDFGIAKLMDQETAAGQTGDLTQDAAPMTPEYASPEQVLGEPVTTASDVYALGVMLFQLLTGRSPYRLKIVSAPALFHAITESDPEKPSDAVLRNEEVTGIDGKARKVSPVEAAAPREASPERLRRRLQGDLDVILLAALRKEPARRYQSAERFSDDLRRHLEGHPVSARKDTVTYRVSKFVQRHRTGVAVTAALVLGLIASTITSLHYARVAVREQSVAERRFNEVRQLARFVLFEFDDAIRSGETAARKTLVSTALGYLNRLSQEAAGDPSLQREVVEAYLKMGTIQGNLYSANVGETAGAVASYRRALELAETLARGNPDNSADQQLLAKASLHLGDLVALGGDRQEALKTYQKAIEILEREHLRTPGSAAEKRLVEAAAKIGFVQFQLGDLPAALASYTRSLDLGEKWLKQEPESAEARKAVAMASGRVGEILARTGKREEGIEKLRSALATYQARLEANPENAAAKRDVAATSLILGDTLYRAAQIREAVDSYRQALALTEELLKADPRNQQFQRDLHITLGRLADILPEAGQREQARAMTQRALQVLRPLVDLDPPGGYDIQQYVWLLVTTPFQELRDAARALPYAKKAVAMTKSSHPGTMDALARAYFGVGDAANAIATEEKALALLPPVKTGEPVSGLRKELEENLSKFRGNAGAPAAVGRVRRSHSP